MRRAQRGSSFRLALKTLHRDRRLLSLSNEHLGSDELDRSRASEHAMLCAIYLPHPSALDQFTQLITAHLARLSNLLSQARDDARDDNRNAHENDIRIMHDESRVPRAEI